MGGFDSRSPEGKELDRPTLESSLWLTCWGKSNVANIDVVRYRPVGDSFQGVSTNGLV